MTNLELAAILKKLYSDYRVHYVTGACLQKATDNWKQYHLNRFDNRAARKERIMNAKPDEYFGDCVCTIKAILYGGFTFEKGGMAPPAKYDFTTEQFINRCIGVSNNFNNCVVGECLYKSGHVGVIVDILPDGRIVSAEVNEKYGLEGLMLTACNCKIEGYNTQEWERHGRIPEVTYVKEEKTLKDEVTKRLLCKKGDKGEYVREIQNALIKKGFSCGVSGADGDFGNGTEKAVTEFQTTIKRLGFQINVDGIVGYDTIKYLLIGF